MTRKQVIGRVIAGGAVVVAGAAPHDAEAQDVAGFYAGASLSLGSGTLSRFGDYSIEGTALGAFAGYNMVNGDWVYGGEIAYHDGFDIDDNGYLGGGAAVDGIVDVRARLGRVFGNTLIYGALGYSMVNDVSLPNFRGNDNVDADGVSFGLGFETAIGANGFVGVDVTRRNLGLGGTIGGEPVGSYTIDVDALTTASIRAGFRF